MANSEYEGKDPGQGTNRDGYAGQPFENQDEQQPKQFTWRQESTTPGTTGPGGEPVEPPGPLGQSRASSDPSSTRYSPNTDPYWRDEPRAPMDEQHAQPMRRDGPGAAEPLYTEGTTQPIGAPTYNARHQPPAQSRGRANLLVGALTGALLCLLIGGLVGWQIGKHNGVAQTSPTIGYKNGGMSPEQIIAQDRQAVVQINVKMAQGGGVGSGVIIDAQGNIITNDHVVSGGQAYNVVLFDGTSLPAKLVGVDAADDLAVVRITPPSKMYVMPIGDSSKLEVGNGVLAIGNPLGITQTVTQGIVSALGRTVSEGSSGGVIVDAVQTDAPINPGNSGGALVSLNGELVGIPTLVAIDPEFKTPANGVGFAVPSNRVKFIAPQLIQYGKVIHSGRAALQASVTTVDPLVAAQAGLAVDHGVLIVATTPKGAAANAGLRAGDVITGINNVQINNASDLSDALLSFDPGATVTVNLVRGTQQPQVKVKLGELTVS